MKVMISQPMRGKSEEQIKNERANVIEKFNKLHIEVVDTIFTDEAPKNSNEAVHYLAKSIDAMKYIDAIYFMKDWQIARGCKVERKVAEEYGIKILDTDFLEEGPRVKRSIYQTSTTPDIFKEVICEMPKEI